MYKPVDQINGLVAGEVTFQDKISVFWLASFVSSQNTMILTELADNIDMKIDRTEFCKLYNSVTSQAADSLLRKKMAGNPSNDAEVCAVWWTTCKS